MYSPGVINYGTPCILHTYISLHASFSYRVKLQNVCHRETWGLFTHTLLGAKKRKMKNGHHWQDEWSNQQRSAVRKTDRWNIDQYRWVWERSRPASSTKTGARVTVVCGGIGRQISLWGSIVQWFRSFMVLHTGIFGHWINIENAKYLSFQEIGYL